ncbi:MAG: hypothetical protein WB524_05540 [Acidobacteriaceae bacterium]|jgi:hypothetical protein
MRFRTFSGYVLYPLLAVLLLVPFATRAQDTSSQQSTQQSDQTQPTDQSQSQSSPQQRAEVLREAQARVNARRKIRIRQVIQDTYSHKYELDAGGGSLRFTPGNSLQRMNEAGWRVDFTDYLHGDLGVTADFRGYYGTAYTGTNPYSVFNPSISQYTFMGGATYRFFKGQHWGWTAQALAGAGHGNFGTGTNGLPPQLVGLFTDTTVLNLAGGAAADYNLSPAIAIRFSATELITNYGSNFQKNLGGNLGIVYRFGRQ